MIRQKNIAIKTSSATLTYAEMGNIICSSPNDITITLPTPNAGLWYRISNAGEGIVTLSYVDELTKLYKAGQCICDANGTSEWFLSSDISRFQDLQDAPKSFIGHKGKTIIVNQEEDGLEIGNIDATHLLSRPIEVGTFVGKDGYVLAYSETTGGFYLKVDDGGGGDTGGEEGDSRYAIRTFEQIARPTYWIIGDIFGTSKPDSPTYWIFDNILSVSKPDSPTYWVFQGIVSVSTIDM